MKKDKKKKKEKVLTKKTLVSWLDSIRNHEKEERDLRNAIKKKEKKLRNAILREDYELAATLRDELINLKKK